MWSVFTLAGNYGKVVYYLEPQLRIAYLDNPFQQFLTNVGAGYKFTPNTQIWVGQTFSEGSQDAVPGSVDEYRLWQQVIWKHPLPFASLISRTRFEERKSLFFPDWAYRLRQKTLINKPLTNNLSLVISDEAFINVNNASWIITNRFDQNRAYIGIEQRMTANTYFGVGYMNQYLSTSIPQSDQVLVLNWRVDLEESG